MYFASLMYSAACPKSSTGLQIQFNEDYLLNVF